MQDHGLPSHTDTSERVSRKLEESRISMMWFWFQRSCFMMFLVDPTAVSCVRSAERLDATADQADTI